MTPKHGGRGGKKKVVAMAQNDGLISFDEMLEPFDIYRYKWSDENFVLFPREENEESPIVCIENGDIRLIPYDMSSRSDFRKSRKKAIFFNDGEFEKTTIERVPQDVKTALLSVIMKHFHKLFIQLQKDGTYKNGRNKA